MKDDEPLLFHTGLRGIHAEIREAVSSLINLSELRHISFSHFESDECGSLHEWLAAPPKADVICSQLGALVNMNDFNGREARGLPDGGTFATEKYRFRYYQAPHLPHGWALVSSSKKRGEHCSVRTSSIIWATSNHSPLPMSWPLASLRVCSVHTTYSAELENARHHAWSQLLQVTAPEHSMTSM